MKQSELTELLQRKFLFWLQDDPDWKSDDIELNHYLNDAFAGFVNHYKGIETTKSAMSKVIDARAELEMLLKDLYGDPPYHDESANSLWLAVRQLRDTKAVLASLLTDNS